MSKFQRRWEDLAPHKRTLLQWQRIYYLQCKSVRGIEFKQRGMLLSHYFFMDAPDHLRYFFESSSCSSLVKLNSEIHQLPTLDHAINLLRHFLIQIRAPIYPIHKINLSIWGTTALLHQKHKPSN